MSAIFYRLNAYGELQKSYFENVQRLHEAGDSVDPRARNRVDRSSERHGRCHHEFAQPLNIYSHGTWKGEKRSLKSP